MSRQACRRKFSLGRAGLALAVSMGVHAAIAIAVGTCLAWTPRPQVAAELDLSSVELSLVDEDDEAAVSPAAPSAPASVPAPPPTPPPRDAPAEPPPPDIPPEAAAPVFAEPTLPPEPFEPPVPPTVARAEAPEAVSDSAGSAASAPRQARVDAPPRPRRPIRPDYPRASRKRGEEGSVLVEIGVDAAGRVSVAEVLASSGFAELDAAALKAVRAAAFTPAESDGKPVPSVARLTLTFRLK